MGFAASRLSLGSSVYLWKEQVLLDDGLLVLLGAAFDMGDGKEHPLRVAVSLCKSSGWAWQTPVGLSSIVALQHVLCRAVHGDGSFSPSVPLFPCRGTEAPAAPPPPPPTSRAVRWWDLQHPVLYITRELSVTGFQPLVISFNFGFSLFFSSFFLFFFLPLPRFVNCVEIVGVCNGNFQRILY